MRPCHSFVRAKISPDRGTKARAIRFRGLSRRACRLYSKVKSRNRVGVNVTPRYSILAHRIFCGRPSAAASKPEVRDHSAMANINRTKIPLPGTLPRRQIRKAATIENRAVANNKLAYGVKVKFTLPAGTTRSLEG